MSEVKVNKISPRSGTGVQLGDSGDTITVPSGAILTTTNATVNLPATTTVSTELKTNKISPASGTAFTLGDSGDTFTVPAGATITNSGTATGFGGDNTPNLYVTKSANQSISANTWTKITLDQELFDSDNVFASDKFTVPSAGKYLITITVRCDEPNASQHVNIALYKNGAYFNGATNDRAFANTNGHELFLQSTTLLNLAQNDYLELYARANGNAENISGATGGTPTGQESYTSMQGLKIIE